MIEILIASILAAASDPMTEAPSLKDEPVRYCRAIVEGVSRTSDVTICRTKAQWRRKEMCQGVTRYCPPGQKVALAGTPSAFALSEDARVVCRVLTGTGSRISQQRVCLPNREWQRMWDDSRDTTGELQNNQSKQPRNE